MAKGTVQAEKNDKKVQEGGSVVKNTEQSCKGIKFNSQKPH